MSVDTYPPQQAGLGSAAFTSYEEGSFALTATGLTTAPSWATRYVRVGRQITLMVVEFFGTSNASTFTLTGTPAALVPGGVWRFACTVQNNGTYQSGILQFNGTTIELLLASTATFTPSGAKALLSCSVTYMLP